MWWTFCGGKIEICFNVDCTDSVERSVEQYVKTNVLYMSGHN